MAIDVIQLPTDGTGKKVAARSYTESAQTVYAQAGYLTTDTAAGNPAAVQNTSPSSEYGLVTRNIPSGTQPVSGTFWQATQPVSQSGTWTVQPGNTANSTAWLVTGTGGTFPATQSGTWTVGLTNDPTVVDNAGFTDGSTKLDMAGFIFDEVAGTALTENDAAAARIDSKRAIIFALEDATTRGRRATITSGGALLVDATATTQSVSGTVAATQSGTWNINAITTLPALPANQTVNVAQINGVTPLMGNGVTGTGSQRVTIASDNTAFSVNAVQSGTWTVQPGNTQNSTAWLVQDTSTLVDNAAFTDGTTRVIMGGYIFDEVAGTALTENDAASARIDSKRAQVLVIEDGTTRGQRAGVSAAGGLNIAGTQAGVSTTNWTSATGLNTANSISVTGMNTVTVAMSNTSTMTGGVLTFEVSPDGGTSWFPITMARIDSYTVETTYTLNTVAVRAWSTSVDGFTNFRVRLSTVITGSGTATVFVTAQTFAIEPIVSVGQATPANLQMTVGAALPAGGNIIGAVTQSGTWNVTATAPTSGGYTTAKILAAGSNNATSVKGSAAQLFGWYLFNNAAYTVFLKIFNKASSPTVGTDSPIFQLAIPAGGAANAFSDVGIALGTGLAYAIVKDIADLGTTAVVASDLAGALFYL